MNTTPSRPDSSPQRSRSFLRRAVLLFLPLFLLLGGCNEMALFSDLKEGEANEIVAILTRQRISCQKLPGKEGAFIVMVAGDRFHDAVSILKQYGLPAETFQGVGETFKKSGLVSSPTEERIRFMHALSQDLEETISSIDGIIQARVHIVLPDNNPYAERLVPSSAAVFIKYYSLRSMEEVIARIKSLVVNSIEGLSYDRVSVAAFPMDKPELIGDPEERGKVRFLTIEMDADLRQRIYLFGGAFLGLVLLIISGSIAMAIRSRKAAKANAPAPTPAEKK